ncbi:hypothetical protein AQUCO_00300510v1, partial [Aquilegia coerulea]
LSDAAAVASPPTRFSKTITIKASGGGDYKTISDAIDEGVPENNSKWIRIIVHSGTYKEKVVIPVNKPYIFLDGENWGNTVITYNGHINLQDSAFQVAADNFVARHITFKNTYNHDYKVLQGNKNPQAQAVAAFIQGDKNSFYQCSFIGLQDTLWDSLGRHFFQNCYIEGSVDFIFGDGQSVYEDLGMSFTVRFLEAKPDFYLNLKMYYKRNPDQVFITAHIRSKETEPTGFVFKYCNVIGTGPTLLGRAWGPYSRVLYYKTQFADIISPEGWYAWGKNNETNLFYAEEDCTGPGSDTSKRVAWQKKLTPAEVNFFTGSSFNNKDHWIENQPIRRRR